MKLKFVVNTHSHGDHTVGNNRLLRETKAEYIDYQNLLKGSLELDNEDIHVYKTPGHTADSIIFQVGGNLLTGDTLFIGKVGRCFSGDLKEFLDSVKLIKQLPDESLVYPGHDYVEEYMAFVKKLEPDNSCVNKILDNYDSGLVRSTLGLEKKLNPFLRFNEDKIFSLLEDRGLPVETEYDRWESLISLM
jgi:hydroxyacylglutathione hydrolase